MEKTAIAKTLLAAAGIAALAGCATFVSGGAEAATPSPTAADGGDRLDAAIRSVTDWLEPYRAVGGVSVERTATNVWIRCGVGRFPSLFSVYSIIVELDAERDAANCYGMLPTIIPDERRAAATEFLYRAECAYGASMASLTLCGGEVYCTSWIPLKELERSPEKSIPLLAGSVIEKLYVCSTGIGAVLAGVEEPAAAAARMRPVGLFGPEPAGAEANAKAADFIFEKLFSDNERGERTALGDWIEARFADADSDDHAVILRPFFTELGGFSGGAIDELRYALVVKDGLVRNVCPVPLEIPEGKLAAVADAAMRLNESFSRTWFGVDFDNRKIWCQCVMPVAALESDGICGAYLTMWPASEVCEKFARLRAAAE